MVDIGFTGTVLEKKYCRYMPFYQDELVVIMPNTEFYQEIQKRYKTATWIKNEPVIMREEGSGTRKETEKILRKAGIMPDTLNIVACIENPEAIKRSVKSGPWNHDHIQDLQQKRRSGPDRFWNSRYRRMKAVVI